MSAPTFRLRETFQSPFDQFADRVGQPYTYLGAITEPDNGHDEEVLPMYRIRFADGVEIETWPEEINADELWQPAAGEK